jgi:hypothetical protein
MRAAIAVLASIFLYGIPIPSLAQNLNDIINQLPGIARSEIAKRAESEWNRLPQSERTCVNQKLIERGDSIQSLARQAILPSDSRVADVRSQCRVSPPPAEQEQSSAQTKPSAPPVDTPVVAQPAPAQQTPAQATSPQPTAAQPAQSAPPQEPRPAQSAAAQPQAEQSQPELTLYELRQTNERLKSDLADSAMKIAELEKTKAQLERAVKDSERARFDIENDKGIIEEMRIADKGKFDAALGRVEADKTDAIDKGRTWELFAYAAFSGLIVLLAIIASVLLMRWKRATPATTQGIKS